MSIKKTTKFKETDIGPIPEEWELLPLKKLTTKIGSGATPRGGNDTYSTDGKYRLIRSQNIFDDHFEYSGLAHINEEQATELSNVEVKENDVLLNITGASLGRVNIVPVDVLPARVNQHVAILRTNEKLNYIFLKNYLCLQKVKSYILGHNAGATREAITKGMVENFIIPVPDINEQKKIAEILSSINDKIELSRKISVNLEKLAGAIFKKWFVNVGDDLPKGWKIGRVSDLIRVESGFPFNSGMFDCDGDYKLVTIKNVQDGFFVPECTDSLSKIPPKVPPHCKLKNGDILLSLTGNVGRVCLIYGENYLLNQRVANLVPINENNRAFTYFLFRQKEFQNILMSISRGTAQQNLSPIETKSLEIVIPSQEALDSFADVANPIFQKLVENNKEIGILSATRDTLLPRLMSGKIRV